MKSGELSIVAGVYLLTLAYMMGSVEWTLAGGLLLLFGVVLMMSELLSDKDARVLTDEEKKVLADYRGKQVYDYLCEQSTMFSTLKKTPWKVKEEKSPYSEPKKVRLIDPIGEHPPGPIPEPRPKHKVAPMPEVEPDSHGVITKGLPAFTSRGKLRDLPDEEVLSGATECRDPNCNHGNRGPGARHHFPKGSEEDME